MGHYDVAQICLNGHLINDSAHGSPSHNRKFCKQCGAATTTECPACNAAISGDYYGDAIVIGGRYRVPAYCENCGRPFPWTASRVAAAKELAEELPGLTDEQKKSLATTVDDLLSDTARTPLAESRFRKLMVNAGKDAAEAMRKLLIDVVSETVKKTLFP